VLVACALARGCGLELRQDTLRILWVFTAASTLVTALEKQAKISTDSQSSFFVWWFLMIRLVFLERICVLMHNLSQGCIVVLWQLDQDSHLFNQTHTAFCATKTSKDQNSGSYQGPIFVASHPYMCFHGIWGWTSSWMRATGVNKHRCKGVVLGLTTWACCSSWEPRMAMQTGTMCGLSEFL
jgi:hypothetical protein